MKYVLLCIDENHCDVITAVDGVRVASTYAADRQTRRLLAERLVLCWNACYGLTNSEIANGLTPRLNEELDVDLKQAAIEAAKYAGIEPNDMVQFIIDYENGVDPVEPCAAVMTFCERFVELVKRLTQS